jgi:hypothetical protein
MRLAPTDRPKSVQRPYGRSSAPDLPKFDRQGYLNKKAAQDRASRQPLTLVGKAQRTPTHRDPLA